MLDNNSSVNILKMTQKLVLRANDSGQRAEQELQDAVSHSCPHQVPLADDRIVIFRPSLSRAKTDWAWPHPMTGHLCFTHPSAVFASHKHQRFWETVTVVWGFNLLCLLPIDLSTRSFNQHVEWQCSTLHTVPIPPSTSRLECIHWPNGCVCSYTVSVIALFCRSTFFSLVLLNLFIHIFFGFTAWQFPRMSLCILCIYFESRNLQ